MSVLRTVVLVLLAAGASGASMAAPRARAVDIAREHLERRLAPAGDLVVVRDAQGVGGVRFVTFEQRFGLPVAGSRTTVAIDAAGRIVAVMPGTLAPAGPLTFEAPEGFDAATAVAALGLHGESGARLQAVPGAPARSVLVPVTLGAEPAMRVRVAPQGEPANVEDLYVSLRDGSLLRRESAHFHAVDSIRAFPRDPLGASVLVPVPDPVTRLSVHSPLGWADDLETSGNNARVVLDRAAAANPDGPRAVATGMPPSLDFPFTANPVADTDAALANVFYLLNDAHDRFRALGFDEASGAMQLDSYGRGGVDGDRVVAFVQSGSVDGTTPNNVASLSLGVDGSAARLTLGLFRAPSNEIRDPAFEADLIYHEYAHAVLARLAGNAACYDGTHPRALAEGWADFFAASLTDDPVIGGWVSELPATGLRTLSLEDNRYTLFNFCFNGCNVNRNGEIWAGVLWDIRKFLRMRLGVAEGNVAAEQFAFEALRYLRCAPTFLDARDAVLLAEREVFSNQYHCDLWNIFLQRGLGADATTTGPADVAPVPGFGLPPECSGGASLRLDQAEYGVEGEILIHATDAGPGPAPTVTVTSTSGDAESVVLSVQGTWLDGALVHEAAAPSPGDGVLQVANGDTITATYAARGLTATAGVSGDASVGTLLHVVLGSGCQGDDDHLAAPGYGFIPGFLDAGEAADIVIAAVTSARGPLEDATVEVVSLNPNVSIAPSGPIPLGTVAPAPPGGTTLMVFIVSAAASPSTAPGEMADLQLTYRARGRTSVNVYPIQLEMDYVRDVGLSPFDAGVETFEPSSSTRNAWTHQSNLPGADSWNLLNCAGDGSPFGYANSSAACATYPDGQGAPSLVSPPIVSVLPPDAVGWHVVDLSWRHRVALYADPSRPDCQNDIVGVFLTEDPAGLPYDDGYGVLAMNAGAPLRVLSAATNTAGLYAAGTPAVAPTGPRYLTPGQAAPNLRLAWVFFPDVDDPANPNCVPRVNDGSYLLDDVRLTYEILRAVPANTNCPGECKVLARAIAVPAGPACPGAAFEIDASASSIAGCTGAPVYKFTGPGVPPQFASTPLSRAPAVFDPAGTWGVEVACESGPICRASVVVTVPSRSSAGRGGLRDGTVRAHREGDDVMLTCLAITDPPSHGAWRATTRAELAAGLPAFTLAGQSEGESLIGEVVVPVQGAATEAGLACYLVLPRDPCTDAPRP